jgi:formylglycine-generating enzyme required for sulfatase activity
MKLLWGQHENKRLIRGGSWNNNQRNARCACRNRDLPDNFNNNIGFRMILSISLSPCR